MEFLISYRWVLAVLVAVAVYVLVDHRTAMQRLREAILGLMLRAEKAAKNGEFGVITGPELMDLVVKKVMMEVVPTLPAFVRPFTTEENVRRVAQLLYDRAQKWLVEGKF